MLISFFLLAASATAQKPYRGAEYRTVNTMTYGRFEVRMRTAQVSGMLGSFFTYFDQANPWNEIDIENMGRYSNESQFNTIVPTQADNHVYRDTLRVNPHGAFHVYAIEWTPQYVAWQFDGAEVYRQTGPHIALLNRPQKLMMNIWQPAYADWAGSFTPATLPVYVYYDWVKYYAYTPGVNDNFTLQWTDDFNSFDAARWQKATHTWDGNNAQFVQENAVLKDGCLILCLTSNTTSGYSGGTVIDADVDPPYITSAVLFADSTILVRFSEPVDQTWAEDPAHYAGGTLTMKSAALLADTRTVRLAVGGALPASSFPLIVLQAKDRSAAANVKPVQSALVLMPLAFPLRIDVGGTGSSGYLSDSSWTPSKAYGAVGGTAATVPSSTPVAGTSEPDVYRTSLHGLSDYKIRVPNGIYKLTLMMMEDRFAASGNRRFSARAEGKTLFTDLDLAQQAGFNTAYAFVAPAVEVQDNVLDLWFGASADSTTLSGIQVERLAGPTGLRNASPAQPEEFSLSVYPNPFNASAHLRFSLPQPESLTFSLHDVLGREVEHHELGLTGAGDHDFTLDASQLASGVYFCRLSSRHFSANRRVVLMK